MAISKRRQLFAGSAATVLVVGSCLLVLASRGPGSETPGSSAHTSPADASATASAASWPANVRTGDWAWRTVAEPMPAPVAAVTNGYLGECVAAGRPALCTSADGVDWSTSVQPAIFRLSGGSDFAGWSVAHGSTGWVGAGTVDPGTWRSADGVEWLAVDSGVAGLRRAHVQAMAAGFAMIAQTSDGTTDSAVLLTSTDGTIWQAAGLPADVSGPNLAGDIGLVASRIGADAQTTEPVVSADGSTWRPLSLPSGIGQLSGTIRLPDGTYIGLGKAALRPFATADLVLSTDGITWQESPGPGDGVSSMALVGDRVLAVALISGSSLHGLFESADGLAWSRVAVLDGHDLSATEVVALGDYAGLLDGSRLAAVGRLLPASATPTPGESPRPTPTATETATSPAEALVVGGWRWHPLDGHPYLAGSIAVKVANGYFARCGSSMCTSPNGWSWRVPADPSIFSTDDVALFSPISVAHGSGTGVVVNAAEGVWYTVDGVHWRQSAAPKTAAGPRAVLPAADGYTLVGDDGNGWSPLYASADGSTWTPAGRVRSVFALAQGDMSGGLLTQTIGTGTAKVANSYSADGRNWVTPSLPSNELPVSPVYRLTSGILVVQGAQTSILTSRDGRSWAPLQAGFASGGLVVCEDRIVAFAPGTDGMGAAWESTDQGRTFHKLMDGVASVAQLGDLVLISTAGASYVGTPLPPSEVPATTPTAPRLPGGSAVPVATPPPGPAGGISRAEAIRVATNAVHVAPDVAAAPYAGASLDPRYGRWVWGVSFTIDYQGPLAADGVQVTLDYFTGEILDSSRWIS